MTGQTASGWAINFCNIKGIPVRVHASFFLLVAWVALDAGARKSPPAAEILFVLGVFGSVLLHELGHALTALRFSVGTKHITLYPFGGIAALERTPSARAELWISAAGPAVNFIIAGALFLLLPKTAPVVEEVNGFLFHTFPQSLAERVFVANIILGIFNLIPALPMDGGRILRAALHVRGVNNATLISSRISQVFSLMFFALGLYSGDPILVVISVFLFLGASQEQLKSKLKRAARDFTVKDALIPSEKLVTFTHGITTTDAALQCTRSQQGIFPVLLGNRAIGVVTREFVLAAGLRAKDPIFEKQYIGDIMNRDFITIPPEESLDSLLEKIESGIKPPFLVQDEKSEDFLGLIEYDRLVEFLLVHDLESDDSTSESSHDSKDTQSEEHSDRNNDD